MFIVAWRFHDWKAKTKFAVTLVMTISWWLHNEWIEQTNRPPCCTAPN